MWELILEGVFWLIYGGSGSWKRRRFHKRYGVEYDLILGRETELWLNGRYQVPDGWSWEINLASAEAENRRFRVKYDDAGGKSGVLEVRVEGDRVHRREVPPDESASTATRTGHAG